MKNNVKNTTYPILEDDYGDDDIPKIDLPGGSDSTKDSAGNLHKNKEDKKHI